MTELGSVPAKRREGAAAGLLGIAVTLVLAGAAWSAPGRGGVGPEDDGRILARFRAPRGVAPEAPAPRRVEDLPAALALARDYIEATRRSGDPRYLGRAEAVLAPFQDAAPSSAPFFVLHATLLQARHDFAGALLELDRALALDPREAQAWLTRATVLTVLGRYEAARGSCERLPGLVTSTVVSACIAPIDAIQGHAARALAALDAALSRGAKQERAWLVSLRGEILAWTSDARAAERDLREVLAFDANDRYTRAVLADLLLDQGRASEAREITAAFHEDESMLLRAALAAMALRAPDAPALARRLQESFAGARLRGDPVHQREEARLLLALGEPKQALARAREAWAVQHEPWDARVVLEAALAAAQPSAADPVLRWLDETGFAAPHLNELARELRSGR